MRKSIFLTVALALAAVANLYAQCTDAPLTPAAGVPHTYTVSVSGGSPAYMGNGIYQWYVTKSAADLLSGAITTPSADFTVSTATGMSLYNSTATTGTTSTLGLTWTTDAVVSGGNYFLVLKYSEGTCTSNMKVMRIQPLNAFKLAIEGSDATGASLGTNANACAANVSGAAYDATANKVTYTYGVNELYYKITAKGFVGQWKPSISLPALAGAGQVYTAAEWTQDGGTTWNSFGTSGATGAAESLTSTALANITDAAAGTPILVRIKVDNQRYETLNNQAIELGADGTYGGAANDALKDKNAACTADEVDFGKKATFKILARPTITATSGAFVVEVH